MNKDLRKKIRKISTGGLIIAIAVLSHMIVNFPLIPQLPHMKYDIGPVFILIGSLIFGPLSAIELSLGYVFIVFFIGGKTGIYGAIMNFLSTCSYCFFVSLTYTYIHTYKGAILALFTGIIIATLIMIPANLIITPIYLKIPATVIMKTVLPYIVIFNLIKTTLNSIITFFIYKKTGKYLKKLSGIYNGIKP